MNIKLAIILSIIFILGIGCSNYSPTSIQSFDHPPLTAFVETITIFLFLVTIIYFWKIERRNNSLSETTFKMLGSLLLPASLISLFLLVLYRIQSILITDGRTLEIDFLGQRLPTDGTVLWFIFIVLMLSIIYLGWRNCLSAAKKNTRISFWKPFIVGTALALVLGIIVGHFLAYGRTGETGLIGGVVLLAYLTGGFIVSLITALIFRLNNK